MIVHKETDSSSLLSCTLQGTNRRQVFGIHLSAYAWVVGTTDAGSHNGKSTSFP